MRARLIILVTAILLVAGFAALNWSEFLRQTPLSFGVFVMDASLGLILLGMLVVTLLAFLASSAHLRTVNLLDHRQHSKALEAQRELAEKAEASRFNDLRQHLDAQMRELQQRDVIAATERDKAMAQSQREMRSHLELMNKTLATRLADIEARIGSRPDDQRTRAPGSTILS
jgi:hypothetical protein